MPQQKNCQDSQDAQTSSTQAHPLRAVVQPNMSPLCGLCHIITPGGWSPGLHLDDTTTLLTKEMSALPEFGKFLKTLGGCI